MARRDRRRREAGAFAVSVLVHLVLLVVLARVAIPTMYQPPSAPAQDVQLQLVDEPPAPSAAPAPRASRRTLVHTLPSPAPARPPAPQRSAVAPARAIQAEQRPEPAKAPQAPPAPPSHAQASIPAVGAPNGAAAGAAGGGARWRVDGGDDGQDGVRKFLRATVGCSHEEYVKLSPVERATCDRRVGRDARMMGSATVDTVGGAKRGYYAAVQNAYQSLHEPRPEYDANGNRIVPGRPPGLGCKFGVDGVSCGVKAPQGVGTEEAGIPPP
jgi:hypothetical protein